MLDNKVYDNSKVGMECTIRKVRGYAPIIIIPINICFIAIIL